MLNRARSAFYRSGLFLKTTKLRDIFYSRLPSVVLHTSKAKTCTISQRDHQCTVTTQVLGEGTSSDTFPIPAHFADFKVEVYRIVFKH